MEDMPEAREAKRHKPKQALEAGKRPVIEVPSRLLILSDIRFLRENLAEVLARDAAFIISGIAKDVDEALAISRLARPHLILIDCALPDGPAAARCFRELQPKPFLVALALPDAQTEVITWAKAGISGFIPRSATLTEIIGYLEDILRGRQSCSTQVAASLLRWISSTKGIGVQARGQVKPNVLTAREQQIAGLISIGLSNKEISCRLDIALTTTKVHVHNLLAKLELQRRGQIAQLSHAHAFRPCGLGREAKGASQQC